MVNAIFTVYALQLCRYQFPGGAVANYHKECLKTIQVCHLVALGSEIWGGSYGAEIRALLSSGGFSGESPSSAVELVRAACLPWLLATLLQPRLLPASFPGSPTSSFLLIRALRAHWVHVDNEGYLISTSAHIGEDFLLHKFI